MEYPSPGRMRSAEAFRARWRELDPELDCDLSVEGREGSFGQAISIWGRELRNRFCAHPMEGWDGQPDGLPTELVLRRWRRFGRSTAALVWGGEAFAVRQDGRANPRQLFLNPEVDVAGGLAALRAQVMEGRAECGAADEPVLIGLQLTHSGRFSQDVEGRPAPRVAFRHPVLDGRVGITSDAAVLSDAELEGLVSDYVRAATLARETGFDFVDVKCCHGYLLHELLAAHTRPGAYGGSFENRTRLLGGIIAAIRGEVGIEIGVRVSICDSYPFSPDPESGVGQPLDWEAHRPYRYGFGVDATDPRRPDFRESRRFLKWLGARGVPLVNVTVGSPYACPHLQRPAAWPPSDGYLPPEDPLLGVAYQIRAARRCKVAAPELVLVGSGYTYLQDYLPHVAQHELREGHVDFVGLGRMMLSYPELVRDVLEGRPLDRKRICRTFSDCTTGPRNGLVSGCYPLDDHYRDLPEAARIREIKLRNRRGR